MANSCWKCPEANYCCSAPTGCRLWLLLTGLTLPAGQVNTGRGPFVWGPCNWGSWQTSEGEITAQEQLMG